MFHLLTWSRQCWWAILLPAGGICFIFRRAVVTFTFLCSPSLHIPSWSESCDLHWADFHLRYLSRLQFWPAETWEWAGSHARSILAAREGGKQKLQSGLKPVSVSDAATPQLCALIIRATGAKQTPLFWLSPVRVSWCRLVCVCARCAGQCF